MPTPINVNVSVARSYVHRQTQADTRRHKQTVREENKADNGMRELGSRIDIENSHRDSPRDGASSPSTLG